MVHSLFLNSWESKAKTASSPECLSIVYWWQHHCCYDSFSASRCLVFIERTATGAGSSPALEIFAPAAIWEQPHRSERDRKWDPSRGQYHNSPATDHCCYYSRSCRSPPNPRTITRTCFLNTYYSAVNSCRRCSLMWKFPHSIFSCSFWITRAALHCGVVLLCPFLM